MPEFDVNAYVYVGVHGSAIVIVVPSRTGPKCDLARFNGDTARIEGGDEGWTTAKRPEYSMTQLPGGVRVFCD